MPSILSRLLGRKKSQDPESPSDKPGRPTALLEGKFEAVSPTVSPSAAYFADPGAAHIRGAKDKESPFHLLRARSRPSDLSTVEKAVPDVPHLSLNLPLTKERGRALDVVFESEHNAFALLNEATIREKRLAPREALSLVRACSQVIQERGLEILGVMHPHWHSASPEVQHRLITLYLTSLASTGRKDPTSPSSPTAPATFEYELQYTRSPHDVAAVLRWGLRHLKLDGDSFGKEPGDWTWYSTFAKAECTSSYPPDAFSKFLIPQLPTAHTELLLATLDIISSLSALCEANGSSGSKLSKLFGLWLLTCDDSTEGDDWSAFYDRWDRAGRILEHLFLARIRDDAHSLPRRLTDLVEHYPYDNVAATPKDGLLPRPRFSTRQYDALFVRLDTEYTGALKPKSHPLRLIADALRAQSTNESSTPEDDGVWDAIKKASLMTHTAEGSSDALAEPVPNFSNIFSDETIRLLSLISVDVSDKDRPAPSFILQSPISPGRTRSFSLPETPLSPVQADRGRSPPPGHAYVVPSLSANNSTAPTTASPETPTDWLKFSSHGFGTIPGTRDLVTTLWDNDVEVTVPPPAPLSRKSSRRAYSQHSQRSSLDSPRTPVPPLPTAPAIPTSKTTLVAKVKLDEAFIDFWADSLLDPISRRWPRFVLCQLKSFPSAAASTTATPAWLVIEQRFVRVVPVLPVKEEAEAAVPRARSRASSPRPESSRLSAAFSVASKRFTFFTGGSSDPKSPREKTVRLPQVGEFGEGAKTEDGAAATADKPEEGGVKGSVDQGAVTAVTAVGATTFAVIGAATATVAAAQKEVTQKPKDDGFPAGAAETSPSELASVSTPKAGESVKDEPPHSAAAQNGHTHHDEEQYELKSETVPAQGPAGSDPLVSPPVTSDLAKTETEPPVSGAEAETAQPEPTSVPVIPYLAGISEGLPTRAEAAPELSVVPVVEEAASAEETVTAPAVPELAISDASILEEPKSVDASAVEPTPAPVQAPVPVPAEAIEEPVVDDTAAAQVAEPEPVVEVKATEQDVPADEVATETELTRTFEEVPAPAAEPVIVCEVSKAALPEGSTEDLLAEPTSTPVPAPASEQTAPEDDISTMREAQVATSADSEQTIVEDAFARDPEPIPDDATPAIQTSPVHGGQSTNSIDAVETTPPLEEPAEVAGESVIKEGAQPASIPERNDAIPEEPDDVEVTAPEPATEPTHVATDTALPALENVDSAAAEEPDVGHAVVVTQSVEEDLPSHDMPQVQDAVIEEQPTAEETNPIPHSSTIPAGGPAASHDDEIGAAPAESAVAENTPVVEPSETSPPEGLEGPVTEPELEPIADDAALSSTDGSAEATVLMNGNESSASPIDEEPSASAPEASPSVAGEPVPPDAEILAAPAAQEPAPITEAGVPVAEIPVPVLETLDPTHEQSAVETSVPVEPGPILEEGGPVVEEDEPVVDKDEPVLEEDVPVHVDEPIVEEDAAVEKDNPVLEEEVPAVEEGGPVPEEDVPVVEEDGSVPVEAEPVLEEGGPVLEEGEPVEKDETVLEEDDPIVEKDEPVLEEGGPVPEDSVVEKDGPVSEEDVPVDEGGPVLEEDDPIVKEDGPVPEEDEPAPPEPPVENSVPLLEDLAPAESTVHTAEEQSGLGETVEADPVVEESPPSEEQVAQEHSSCEATEIATQEEPSDTTAASEQEAPLAAVDPAPETPGAADDDAPSW